MVRDLYYSPKGTLHFNVYMKVGAIENRVQARDIKGPDSKLIDWIYIVEAKRRATTEDIQQLCKGTWKGTA
jgi:hypothetical protein